MHSLMRSNHPTINTEPFAYTIFLSASYHSIFKNICKALYCPDKSTCNAYINLMEYPYHIIIHDLTSIFFL